VIVDPLRVQSIPHALTMAVAPGDDQLTVHRFVALFAVIARSAT
jgi:hypothetical protein